MPGLLLRYLGSFAVATSLLLACWFHGYSQGKDKSKKDLLSYKAEVALENAKTQSRIEAEFQTTLLERENSLQNLRNERDSLLVSLRNRQPRPQPPSSTSSNAPEPAALTSCSPKQLYREDAEALAELAGDAEAVRQELISTRAMYSSVRDAMATGAVDNH